MADIIREALKRGEKYLEDVADLPVVEAPDEAAIMQHLASHYRFDEPIPAPELVDDVGNMLETSIIHTIHPRYFGYFNPTPLPQAVAGDLMAGIFNPQLAVWSHGPAAIEMEQHVLRWLAERFGFDPETAGAHFTSGGSEANLTAVIAALTARFPEYGRVGLAGIDARPTIYHSAGAHDSFTKICHMTGLGRDALRIIPIDDDLRFDLDALQERLDTDQADGFTPVLVVATAGTTAAGIIDPLEETAAICHERGIWYHVDAAWGGAAVLSPRLSGHLAGIELADSIICDAHKWLNVTMGAGVVDSFVTSVQWSRRFIGLKLFMALASLGEQGYAEMIEGQTEIGDYLGQRLEEAGWLHVSRTPLPVCCVTHPRIEAGERSIDEVLDTVLARGKVWISKVKLGQRYALRACITSCLTTREDIDVLVNEMTAAALA